MAKEQYCLKCEKCGHEIPCPKNDLPWEGLVVGYPDTDNIFRVCPACGNRTLVGKEIKQLKF